MTSPAEKKFEFEDPSDSPVDASRVRQILDANHGARIRTWMSICSRCGLCAESCFVYVSNDPA
jgi:ferredoxin